MRGLELRGETFFWGELAFATVFGLHVHSFYQYEVDVHEILPPQLELAGRLLESASALGFRLSIGGSTLQRGEYLLGVRARQVVVGVKGEVVRFPFSVRGMREAVAFLESLAKAGG